MAIREIDDFLNYGVPAPAAGAKAPSSSVIDDFLLYKPMAPKPVAAAPVVEAAPAPVEPEGPGFLKSAGDRVLGTGAASLDIIANTAATANTQTPWDAVPGGSTAFNALETTAGVIGAGKEYLPEFLTDRAQALQRGLASQRVASPETQGPRSEFLRDFESQTREYSAAARGEQTAEEKKAQAGLGNAFDVGVVEGISYLWENPRALGTLVDSLIPSIAFGGAAGKVAAGAGKTAAMAAQLGVGSSLEGMAAGQGAYDSVMKADEVDLAASDLFWKLKEQTGSNEAARQAMADIARTVGSSTATASSLLLAGIGQKYGMNVVEDRLLGRAMKGATGSRTANAVIGFGKEGLTEGTQGATSQLSQNIGAMAGGAEWDLTKGVGSAYALEAIAGAGPGAIAGLTASTKRPTPILPPTGDPSTDTGIKDAADMQAAAEAATSPSVAPVAPRGAFGAQPAPIQTPTRTGAEAATIVDNRIAALQEASKAGRLPPDEVKALDKERTELETIIREQDKALRDNVVLAPANRLTQDERKFIDNRRLEISSKIEKHRTAVAQENELKKLQERLGKVTDDNQFIKLSESLVPVENRVTPVAPVQAPPSAPTNTQSPAVADTTTQTPTTTPSFVDDSLTPADDADLAAINAQLATEQNKTINSEARNRVITELASGKDKRTAAAVQKMIGDGLVQFYGDQATLPEGADSATDKGYFDGTKIYLNESKLGKGEANSVILHEVKHFMDVAATKGGAKISRKSMRSILGDEGNVRANKRIQELADKGNKIAKEAIEDATYGATQADGTVDQAVLQDEISAYFLQKAEIAKSRNKPLGMAVGVVKDILSAAKTRLIDFGIDLNLSENDILYLGKQLVGEAARTQIGQSVAQNRDKASGRAMVVGPKGANFERYKAEGRAFTNPLDGILRAEIDDSRSSIRPEVKKMLEKDGRTFLSALYDHPELYENYNEFKRTLVRVMTPAEIKANPATSGWADAPNNTLVVAPRTLNDVADFRSLMLHEGQHLIQEKEGFVPGASPDEYMDPKDTAALEKASNDIKGFLTNVDRDTLNGISSKLKTSEKDRPVSAQRILKMALEDGALKPFTPEERATVREYVDLLRVYTPLEEMRKDAYDKYLKTGGEVESRTVEARAAMTAGERRETPFYETARFMPSGVKQSEMIDNTKPESGSRLAGYRAAQRQKALSEKPKGRASKTRPEQPGRVTERLAGAGIQQSLSRKAPTPTQARGVVPASEVKKFAGEKTIPYAEKTATQKILGVGDAVLSAILPSTYGKSPDVAEILETALGAQSVSRLKAEQLANALRGAIRGVPKAQRNAAKRTLSIAVNSKDKATREGAIKILRENHPLVFAQFDSFRNTIRQQGIDAVVSVRDSGKQLTKKDVAIVGSMMKNLDTYIHRAYKIDRTGPVADKQREDTLGAWMAGDRTSDGAKAFEDAHKFLIDRLRIGKRKGMLKADANRKDYVLQDLQELESLHEEWVSRENFNALPVDATDEQVETHINNLLFDLENVRLSKSEEQYVQELEDKALRHMKELLKATNTGTSKLVQYFRGARQDNTIVSAREDVPEPIRRVLGEITESTTALATTVMKQGEFLSRQKMLRELYDIALGVHVVDQKDAKSDRFTERLIGDTYGPLEGLYATPRFKQQIDSSIEPLNSWRKVVDAMMAGKADVATQAVAGLSIKGLSKLGSISKKAVVVYNPASWVNNFVGGPATPIMQGFSPHQGLARGFKAAQSLIGPGLRKRMSPEGQAMVQANLQESGQVGEIQRSLQTILQDELLGKKINLKRILGGIDNVVVDGFAMTDVVWKFSSAFATVDWLRDYYKAKGVTRTEEQLFREAAVRVKKRAITFANAPPLIKVLEKGGATSYAAYFAETYRVLGKSLAENVIEIKDGMQEGGEAGAMKRNLAIRSMIGTTMAMAYNRAILPAYELAVGGALLPAMIAAGLMEPPDEEDPEKLAVIRRGMGDFFKGKELDLYRITEDGKYIFFEPGRINPNDPATGPLWAATIGGDPEAALEMASGLLFANQGVLAVLGVAGELGAEANYALLGGKAPPVAKAPSASFNMPTAYNKMENNLQNWLGMSPDSTARVIRALEKFAPKVAMTTMRELTEDTGLKGFDKFLAAMGQPFAIFDPKKDLRMTGYSSYRDPLNKAKDDFKSVIQTTSPSDEVVRGAYLSSIKMEHSAYMRMREVVEAVRATGMQSEAISEILKDKDGLGLNGAQVKALLSGDFQVTFVSPATLDNSFKKEMKEDEKKPESQRRPEEIKAKYQRIDRIIRETTKAFNPNEENS